MTYPGVGPLTELAFMLVIGSAERFRCGKQIASYLGLVPSESPAGIVAGWDISRNKATLCCVSCRWKQPR
jgi:transposase